MKKFFVIIASVLVASTALFAQEEKKGLTLGVDNDEKDYLIASPADNWFFGAGAGIQTYIGNEEVSSARWNAPTPALYLEVGKWILPDLSVSVKFGGFNSISQSRYSLNPYIDFAGKSLDPATGHYPYESTNFLNLSVNGLVTLDWTNFIHGYEKGQQRAFHLLTPVGLGFEWATGGLVNSNPKAVQKPSNFELCFTAGLQGDIHLSDRVILTPALNLLFARGSLDFSPYVTNEVSRFDFMPSATIGIKINLFKFKHNTRYSGKQLVKHYFVPTSGSELLSVLQDELDKLKNANNSLAQQLDSKSEELGAAERQLAAAKAAAEAAKADADKLAKDKVPARELTPMEEIMLAKTLDGLSSCMVYFDLDKSTVDLNAQRRLADFANVVKNSKDNEKFYIIGAADKATGTEKHNYDLSVARCKSIYNILVKNYGVNPAKLELRPLGGIEEYEPKELNRVGIAVLSSDKMTEIVDKYSKKY